MIMTFKNLDPPTKTKLRTLPKSQICLGQKLDKTRSKSRKKMYQNSKATEILRYIEICQKQCLFKTPPQKMNVKGLESH